MASWLKRVLGPGEPIVILGLVRRTRISMRARYRLEFDGLVDQVMIGTIAAGSWLRVDRLTQG